MNKNIKNCFFLIVILLLRLSSFPQRTNFFMPYEWIFDPVRLDCYKNFAGKCSNGVVINALYEGAFLTNGYCGSHVMGVIHYNETCQRKGNPFTLFMKEMNLFSSFLGVNNYCKGNDSNSFVQQYTIYDGNNINNNGFLSGDVSINNIKLSFEKWLTNEIKIGFYLPWYFFSTKNICFIKNTNDIIFESELYSSLKDILSDYGLSLSPYSNNGIGDSLLLLSWQNNFLEQRDYITQITCSVRTGFLLPTRSNKKNEDKLLLPIPLGYDAAWGLIGGGSLEAQWGNYFSGGINAECIILFGSLKKRAIKSDIRQSDLLLLTYTDTFIDPGMNQKFDIYATVHNCFKDYSFTCAYQYNKQHDSDIVVCSDYYSTLIASTTQRLDPWSTHSLTFLGSLLNPFSIDNLSLSLFIKWGIAGERSLVSSTAGCNLVLFF